MKPQVTPRKTATKDQGSTPEQRAPGRLVVWGINPEAGWGQRVGSLRRTGNSWVPWALRTSVPVTMGQDSRDI